MMILVRGFMIIIFIIVWVKIFFLRLKMPVSVFLLAQNAIYRNLDIIK